MAFNRTCKSIRIEIAHRIIIKKYLVVLRRKYKIILMYEAIWKIVFVLNSGFLGKSNVNKKKNFMDKDIGNWKHLFTFDDVGKPVRN